MNAIAREKLYTLIGKQLGRENIRSEHRLREDLGADSLDTVELFMIIEDEFGIEIPDMIADSLRTIEDIVSFIDRKSGGTV